VAARGTVSRVPTLAPYADKCVVMYTSYVSNQLFEVAWRKLETTLKGKHVQFVAIDGASPDMKEVRSALWAISGKREYPQVFVKKAFMGGMDELQEALDTGSFQQTYGEFVDLDAVTPR